MLRLLHSSSSGMLPLSPSLSLFHSSKFTPSALANLLRPICSTKMALSHSHSHTHNKHTHNVSETRVEIAKGFPKRNLYNFFLFFKTMTMTLTMTWDLWAVQAFWKHFMLTTLTMRARTHTRCTVGEMDNLDSYFFLKKLIILKRVIQFFSFVFHLKKMFSWLSKTFYILILINSNTSVWILNQKV